MKTIDEMLKQNDFEELAEELRIPENRTFTRVMIDLSDGEVWLCVEGPGEEKYYRSETIIEIMVQRQVPYSYRTARVIENRVRKALEMFYCKKMEPGDIEYYLKRDEYDNSVPKGTLLPLGSVVKLKDSNDKIMICGRAAQSNDEENTYYACSFPDGFNGQGDLINFRAEHIDEVIFYGIGV